MWWGCPPLCSAVCSTRARVVDMPATRHRLLIHAALGQQGMQKSWRSGAAMCRCWSPAAVASAAVDPDAGFVEHAAHLMDAGGGCLNVER